MAFNFFYAVQFYLIEQEGPSQGVLANVTNVFTKVVPGVTRIEALFCLIH